MEQKDLIATPHDYGLNAYCVKSREGVVNLRMTSKIIRIIISAIIGKVGIGEFLASNLSCLMNDLYQSSQGDNLPCINASPTSRNAVESGAVVRWSGGNDPARSHHLLAQYGG